MEIVNLSLSTGNVPVDYKNAVLIPLLKKISLEQEIFNNFRLISNLVYISKLIEKVIASRLHSHMTNNNLYEELQSSYRKFYSTETALTCVHNDILRAIDDNKSVLPIMLDLSTAFGIVDHDVLLERLKSGLGICGTALSWFKSYLSGRSQCVLINGTQSKPTALVCGVPQGSVLGPILFPMYRLPLGDIIKRHGMQFQIYAEDCQLYTTFGASDINQTALNMEILIDDIRSWWSDNMLKLNDSKTEMMVISSKFRPSVHLESPVYLLQKLFETWVLLWTPIAPWCPILTMKSKNPFLRWGGSPTTVYIWRMNHPKLQSMLMSHQDLIIAIVCSMVCIKDCLKTAKCHEYSCMTGHQNKKIWPYNYRTSRSPLASYRITLKIPNSTFGI